MLIINYDHFMYQFCRLKYYSTGLDMQNTEINEWITLNVGGQKFMTSK